MPSETQFTEWLGKCLARVRLKPEASLGNLSREAAPFSRF